MKTKLLAYLKKIASNLTVVSFALVFVLQIFSVNVNAQIYGKYICEATIEEEFSDNKVLVTIYPAWNEKNYSVSDFAEVDCVEVDKIFSGKRSDMPSHILELTLSEKSKEGVLDAVDALIQRSDVYCAEPNYICKPAMEPNDAKVSEQWALEKISLPDAWEITTGSEQITVGVIDSGIYGDHPDLAGNISAQLSRCFTDYYDDPLEDVYGHGTKVAGVIGAIGNNSIGVAGVCWRVQLISLRVDTPDGADEVDYLSSDVIAAIRYAEEIGIDILNYSAAGYEYNSSMRTAIKDYSGLFVCVASNDDKNNDSFDVYPCNYDLDNIIAVGASTSIDEKRSSSNYGKTSVDLFAPGQDVLTTSRSGGYTNGTGTSYAAPYVAGVAALMLSENPRLTPEQIKGILISSCDAVSKLSDKCVSGGRLNAYEAVRNAHTYIDLTVDNNISVQMAEGQYHWYRFTVPTTGWYYFYTEGDEVDTVGELYSTIVPNNSTNGRIEYNDDEEDQDEGDDSDFNCILMVQLTAGQVVYLRVSARDWKSDGIYTLTVSRTPR